MRASVLALPLLLVLGSLPAGAATGASTLWLRSDGTWGLGPPSADGTRTCGGNAPLKTECTIGDPFTQSWVAGFDLGDPFVGGVLLDATTSNGGHLRIGCLALQSAPISCKLFAYTGDVSTPGTVTATFDAGLPPSFFVPGGPDTPVLPLAAGMWSGLLITA